MNHRSLLIVCGVMILCVAIIVFIISTRQAAVRPSPTDVTVSITTNPSPIKLLLDQQAITTPFTGQVSPGKHTVALTDLGHQFYQPFIETIEVTNTATTFHFTLTKESDVSEGGPLTSELQREISDTNQKLASLPLIHLLPKKTSHYYLDVPTTSGEYLLLIFSQTPADLARYTNEAKQWIASEHVDPNALNLLIQESEPF